jgi:exonuclease SbcD
LQEQPFMIKLLHLADLHIGTENYGRIDSTSGLHTRLQDYLERLDESITLGLNEGVDLVLIAGDIYKNRTPNPTHQREFARRIDRLRAEGVPVFLLVGNHDISPSLGRAHSIDIFSTLRVEGITIADKTSSHTIPTRGGPVQIIAVPWVTRHHLLTRDDMRMASFAEIEAMLRQRIEHFITNAAARLDPALPAVLALHCTIDGAQVGAERGITLGGDMVLPRSIVTPPGIDYVALGHIHRHQALGEHPPVVYPGSIERLDFGEASEDKGCVLVELEKGAARWHFHKLAARPFHTINVDVRASGDPRERIARAIPRHTLHNAVARVEIKATPEQVPLIEEAHIRACLDESGAFIVASIAIEAQRERRRRFAEAEQELMRGISPRRALELYFKAKEKDPQRAAALLAAADKLLSEEYGVE